MDKFEFGFINADDGLTVNGEYRKIPCIRTNDTLIIFDPYKGVVLFDNEDNYYKRTLKNIGVGHSFVLQSDVSSNNPTEETTDTQLELLNT